MITIIIGSVETDTIIILYLKRIKLYDIPCPKSHNHCQQSRLPLYER